MHRQRPRHVVVRRVGGIHRELLRLEEIDGVVAVRLGEIDHERAGGEAAAADGERAGRPRDLDALAEQHVHHLGHAARVALIGRDRERVGSAVDALLPGVPSLAIEVAEELVGVLRGEIENGERGRLLIVGVVAHRPAERALRRPRAIPLARRLAGGDRALEGLGRSVAEGFVAAADRVVVHRDRIEVVVAERLAELPGPDARHPHAGHRRHLVQAHLEEFVRDDRIEVRVVRARAVPGLQQRDAFVQVVDDGRVIAEEHPVHGARERFGLLMRVAIGVHEHVLAPVGRRLPRQGGIVGLALEEPVEPVGHLVAAVRVRHRVDQDDDARPDLPDHRLIGDRQPVRQLHHHLGAAGFVGVQRRVEVVNGSGAGDDPIGVGRRRSAWIGQRGRGRLQAIEIADACFVGDGHEQDVPSLFGPADRLHVHPRRRLGQRPEVAVDLLRVRQVAGGAGDVPEVVGRRGHRGRLGDVAHPRADESRLGREAGNRVDRAWLRRVRTVRALRANEDDAGQRERASGGDRERRGAGHVVLQ